MSEDLKALREAPPPPAAPDREAEIEALLAQKIEAECSHLALMSEYEGLKQQVQDLQGAVQASEARAAQGGDSYPGAAGDVEALSKELETLGASLEAVQVENQQLKAQRDQLLAHQSMHQQSETELELMRTRHQVEIRDLQLELEVLRRQTAERDTEVVRNQMNNTQMSNAQQTPLHHPRVAMLHAPSGGYQGSPRNQYMSPSRAMQPPQPMMAASPVPVPESFCAPAPVNCNSEPHMAQPTTATLAANSEVERPAPEDLTNKEKVLWRKQERQRVAEIKTKLAHQAIIAEQQKSRETAAAKTAADRWN